MWDIIAIILGVVGVLYLWLTYHYDYWKKYGIPYIEPILIFGTAKDTLIGKDRAGFSLVKHYNDFSDEPAVGLFKLRQPQLLLRDMDLAKAVLVKEFSSFRDNDVYVDVKVDPILGRNPFVTKGNEWKAVRSIHTQNQSSGKIKQMFSMMEEVNIDMLKYLEKKQGDPIETKFFSGQYTTDVVGSCVYGLKGSSFADENSQFRKMSAQLFDFATLPFLLATFAPTLATFFRTRILPKAAIDFFVKIVSDMYDYRIQNNVKRNDFLGNLMEENVKQNKTVYTKEELTAHSLTFFLDGYETSGTVMSFILYILAVYPEIQERVRNEILAKEKENANELGKIDYDFVHNLQYLDAVFNETLRMYPPGITLTRVCNNDITLTSGKRQYFIKKGMTVLIPVYAIMNDSKYFPEPSTFNPDRFYKQPTSPYFFPFGLGPRACLGSRFAITQIKAGVVNIIKNFQVVTAEGNGKLPEIDHHSLFLASKYPCSRFAITQIKAGVVSIIRNFQVVTAEGNGKLPEIDHQSFLLASKYPLLVKFQKLV